MTERLVRQWADEALYHRGGNQYQLWTNDNKLIGEIRARSDEEATQKSALVARDEWEKRKVLSMAIGEK